MTVRKVLKGLSMKNSSEKIVRLNKDELFDSLYREFAESLFGSETIDQRLLYSQWLFAENPALLPDKQLPIYIFWIDSRPVGQLGIIPANLTFCGNEVRGGWTIDFFVRPEGQRRGIGKKLLQAAFKDFPILMTLGQTDASFGLFIKCGWHKSTPLTRYKKLLHPVFSLPKMVLKKTGMLAKIRNDFLSPGQRDLKLPADVIVDAVDSFLDIEVQSGHGFFCKRGTTFIQRSKDFLQWRYFSNPFVEYNVYRIHLKGFSDIIVVWRIVHDKFWCKAIIVDFLYGVDLTLPAMRETLKIVMEYTKFQGAEMIECQTSDPLVLNALSKSMFSSKDSGARFLYGVADMSACPLIPTEDWSLFSGDCDVEALSTKRVS